jgi:hypothetical protein
VVVDPPPAVVDPPERAVSPSPPPQIGKKKKPLSRKEQLNESVSRTRLKILWMLEFITDSEHVPFSLKVEYCKIATQQLVEDDPSLGMPRVLTIRILLEEMKYVCGEDGANWDWQERSLKLYPILLKILYTMDLKGEEKLDERMRPHKKIMALAFVSHMVQLVIERQLNEFKRVWESQVYAELKETPQGKMDGVRDELEWLDEIGQRFLEIERINTDKKTTEKFDLDTFGGDGPLSPGKQLQDNLNSTDELELSGKNSRITGTHFEDSVNELLKELKAYYKRAKVALGPTFLQEASMDISHEKYSPNLDEDKILIRADKDLERNLESIRGGKDSEVDDDSEDEFEQTPNRIVTPKNVNIFAKDNKKQPLGATATPNRIVTPKNVNIFAKDNKKRPLGATAKNNDAERQPEIFKKIKIKIDGRKGGKTVNARDIQFDTELQNDDPYEFPPSEEEEEEEEEEEDEEEEEEEEEGGEGEEVEVEDEQEEEQEESEEEKEEEGEEEEARKRKRDEKFLAWNAENDERLLDGVEKHGYGRWKKIVLDEALHNGLFTGLNFEDVRYKHKRIMVRAGANANALLLPRKVLVALFRKKAPNASIKGVTRLQMAKSIDDPAAVQKALDEEGWDFSGEEKERQQSPLQKLRDGAVHVLERLVGR